MIVAFLFSLLSNGFVGIYVFNAFQIRAQCILIIIVLPIGPSFVFLSLSPTYMERSLLFLRLIRSTYVIFNV